MKTTKNNIKLFIIFAGLFWGLAGFTVELLPDASPFVKFSFRLIFIFLSSVILLLVLDLKIKKTLQVVLVLLTSYLLVFLLSTIVNNIDFNLVLRELILVLVAIILCMVLSNEDYVFDFIMGVYISLILLTIYYFMSIDWGRISEPFYRLFTELNANGVGFMSSMTFVLAYNYYIGAKKSQGFFSAKKVHLLIIIISIFVVLTTKSRTSIASIFMAFLFMSFYYKRNKSLLFFFAMALIVFITHYETFETILRLNNPQGYGGDSSITNFTGRTSLWSIALDIISNHFLLGIGPTDAFIMIGDHKTNFHNAYLQAFVSTGLLGFIPFISLVLLALKNTGNSEKIFLFKALFLVGLIPSFLESTLLSYGSPGSLVFFISTLYLAGNINSKLVRNPSRLEPPRDST